MMFALATLGIQERSVRSQDTVQELHALRSLWPYGFSTSAISDPYFSREGSCQ